MLQSAQDVLRDAEIQDSGIGVEKGSVALEHFYHLEWPLREWGDESVDADGHQWLGECRDGVKLGSHAGAAVNAPCWALYGNKAVYSVFGVQARLVP